MQDTEEKAVGTYRTSPTGKIVLSGRDMGNHCLLSEFELVYSLVQVSATVVCPTKKRVESRGEDLLRFVFFCPAKLTREFARSSF